MDCQHLLLILSIAALAISPSYSVTHEILYTICSQTQNEEICVQILESDPNTNSSTLPQLSLISINLTGNQAKKNSEIFTELRDNTTSSSLRVAYESCRTIYQQMICKINEAYQLSQQRRYKDIHQLGQVQTLAYKCENGLTSSSTAPYSETMILTSEASSSVNLYIASSPPKW